MPDLHCTVWDISLHIVWFHTPFLAGIRAEICFFCTKCIFMLMVCLTCDVYLTEKRSQRAPKGNGSDII